MLRTAAVAVVLAASAEAFSTPALTGLRMGAENAQINRKQVLQSAGLAAASVLAAPSLAGAASINKNTGFPEGSCIPNADSAANGCSPMTNTASVLDKQKAVLAGKITVGANKVEALNAAVQAMQVGDGDDCNCTTFSPHRTHVCKIANVHWDFEPIFIFCELHFNNLWFLKSTVNFISTICGFLSGNRSWRK